MTGITDAQIKALICNEVDSTDETFIRVCREAIAIDRRERQAVDAHQPATQESGVATRLATVDPASLIIALVDRWYHASNARRDARREQRDVDAACRGAAPSASLLEQRKIFAQRLKTAWHDECLALDALAKLCRERAARRDAVDAMSAAGPLGEPPTAQTGAFTANEGRHPR